MTGILSMTAFRGGAGLAALIALSACAGATPSPAPAPAPSPAPVTRPAPGPRSEQGEAAAIARARADSLRYPYTAADVHFMQAMIGHHAQAIIMSRLAPTHGASPGVLRLADRIINAQQDEITTMQRWLAERRQTVPEAKPMPMKMVMNGMEHEMMMPGMLTDEQMKQLDEARGNQFDRLFLTFMIQHHKGATSMVQELFGTPGAAQDETVFKFANDVNVDQTTEIARMQQLLGTVIFGAPAP
jgi:uncharacterized protein (DUF305 family)